MVNHFFCLFLNLADSSRGRWQQRRCREAGVKAVEMVQPWRLGCAQPVQQQRVAGAGSHRGQRNAALWWSGTAHEELWSTQRPCWLDRGVRRPKVPLEPGGRLQRGNPTCVVCRGRLQQNRAVWSILPPQDCLCSRGAAAPRLSSSALATALLRAIDRPEGD